MTRIRLKRALATFLSLCIAGSPALAAPSYTYQVSLGAPNMQPATQASLAATPASHDFGTVVLGGSSAVSVTVVNRGQNSTTLTGIGVGAPFNQTNNCPAVLVGGASCTVGVTFVPAAAGSYSGSLDVVSSSGSLAIALAGAAVEPTTHIGFSQPSVTFSSAPVGGTASALVTFTNDGNSPATVSGIGIGQGASDFSQSNNCGASLAPGASCSISLAFRPTAYGARTGVLTVFEEQSQTGYSLALSGYGNAAILSASPTTLSMPSAIVGHSTSVADVTLANDGNLSVEGLNFDVSAGDFSVSASTCLTTLAAGATCTVTVRFTPTQSGPRQASLLAHSSNAGSTSAALSASGVSPSRVLQASQEGMSFESTAVGATTPSAVLRLTNTGNVPLTGVTAAIQGGASDFKATHECPATLAVGAECLASLAFAPSRAGALAGDFRVTFDYGYLSVPLSGTGAQGAAAVTPDSLSFAATQVASSSAVKSVTVTNTGNRTLSFTGVGIASGTEDFSQSNSCASIEPQQVCVVSVSFTPSVPGARSGTLALTHDGSGVSLVELSGEGKPQAASLTAPSFTATAVGASSTAVATLTNTGIGPLSVTVPSGASVTGSDFSFDSTTCGSTVAVAASCSVTVRFAPSSTSPRNGQLSLTTGAGAQSTTWSATAIQGQASVNPGSLTFATQQNATTSATQFVTVTNTGTAPLTFGGIGMSDGASDFAQSNDCSSVAVNGTCRVNVSFTPSAAGSRTGTLSFVHNGSGVTNVSLSGTGQAATATVSTPTWPSAVRVGSVYDVTAVVTNTGIGPVTVSSTNVSGTDFSKLGTSCSSSTPLQANETCNVQVRFAPTAATTRTGTLSIGGTAGGLSANLSATGIEAVASVSPASVSFAAQQTGTTSAAQTVTLTNTGSASMTVGSVSVTSGGPEFTQSSACTTLAVNGNCVISVFFAPTVTGPRNGVLTIAHNGAGGSTAVSLSGTGQAQTASLSPPSFPATAVNASSTADAELRNDGVGPLSVTVPTASSVTGTGFSFVSTNCGTSLAVAGTCRVTVRFSPTSTSAASGTLTIATGAGSKAVTLGSTGIQGYAAVSPSSLSYATQQVGSTSAVQSVTVTNTGTDVLTFTGVGISAGTADYAQSNDCASVAVGGTCTVSVSFTPSATGSRPGTLSFTHNGGGIANVSLSGTGQAASATLPDVAFGNVVVGASGNATATLSNTGLAAITYTVPTAASVTGTDFSFVSTTCSSGTLAANANCNVVVRFAPTSKVVRSGSLSITTQAGSKVAALSGTGIQGTASYSTSSLTYASQTVGTTSTAQSVTVTNTGSNTLTIVSAALTAGSGDYSVSANTCNGASLAANGTCSFSVSFVPASTGSRPGTVTVTNNGSGGNGSITLSGSGVAQPSLSGVAIAASDITVSGTSTFSWTAASATSSSGTCSGAGTGSGTGTGTGGSFGVTAGATPGTVTCTATATNALGYSVTASDTANVVGNPTVTSASFANANTTVGSSNTFTWATTGATSATVSCTGATGSGSGTSGSISVTTSAAGPASCTVTASNAAGAQATRSGSFTIVAAPTLTSAAMASSSITVGTTSTFSWAASNATSTSGSCSGGGTGSNTGSATSGSLTVTAGSTAGSTITCTATATNAAGTQATRQDTAAVVAAASVTTASMNNAYTTSGDPVTFTWATSNASSASVSCSGAATGSTTGTSGSLTVNTSGTGTATCTVTAVNAANTPATGSASTTVVAAPAVTSSSFDQTSTNVGQNRSFSWATSNASTVSVVCSDRASGSSSSLSGSLTAVIASTNSNGTGTCTVTATNLANKQVTDSKSVNVVVAPSVTSASFSPSTVGAGSTSDFSWATSNAASASVSCSGVASGSASGTSGTLTVATSSSGTGTCTVTALNAAGGPAGTATRSANLSVVAPVPFSIGAPTSQPDSVTWVVTNTGVATTSFTNIQNGTAGGPAPSGTCYVGMSMPQNASCTVILSFRTKTVTCPGPYYNQYVVVANSAGSTTSAAGNSLGSGQSCK